MKDRGTIRFVIEVYDLGNLITRVIAIQGGLESFFTFFGYFLSKKCRFSPLHNRGKVWFSLLLYIEAMFGLLCFY